MKNKENRKEGRTEFNKKLAILSEMMTAALIGDANNSAENAEKAMEALKDTEDKEKEIEVLVEKMKGC